MSTDGKGTKWRRNIAENFSWLSRVHKLYRQTTDKRTGDSIYSERESEFTFAKNHMFNLHEFFCMVKCGRGLVL